MLSWKKRNFYCTFVLLLLLGVSPTLHAQRIGLIAYYVVETDSSGHFSSSSLFLPLRSNFEYTLGSKTDLEVSAQDLIKGLQWATAQPTNDLKLSYDCSNGADLYFKRHLRFGTVKSIVFVRSPKEKWKTLVLGSSVGMRVSLDGKLSLDSTYYAETKGHSYSYLHENGARETFLYEKGTPLLHGNTTPKHYLLFVNGYRGYKKDNDPSRGEIAEKDVTGYWKKLDLSFDSVLHPAARIYFDGSHSVRTSSHRTRIRFAYSFARVRMINGKKRKAHRYGLLNAKTNEKGFEYRRKRGALSYLPFETFMWAKRNGVSGVKDTLDIVCHSMGYAYALGFLSELQQNYVLRNIYILAPEGGAYAGFDWNLVNEVWQYGSNLGLSNPDPVWEQDGVAPQSTVKGIDQLNATKGGRICYPESWKRRNFVDSHMTYNFFWIFNSIKKGQAGHVH